MFVVPTLSAFVSCFSGLIYHIPSLDVCLSAFFSPLFLHVSYSVCPCLRLDADKQLPGFMAALCLSYRTC